MKKLAILGSTGVIGQKTLEIVRKNKDKFFVTALAAYSNIDLLLEQILLFQPKIAVLFDENKAKILKKILREKKIKVELLSQEEGLIQAAIDNDVDELIVAMLGKIALKPTIAAIEKKKNVAIATKEIIVSAGELLFNLVKKNNVQIVPLDSEHSAIFQLIKDQNPQEINRLILTASGGPFLETPLEKLKHVTVEEALKHPTYKMGKKISIDSATMMNKGLEIIEAHYFFNIDISKIEVLIHNESIIHSFVEWIDHTLFAQLSNPDMEFAIQYALFYPQRMKNNLKPLDLPSLGKLHFSSWPKEKFLALSLCYEAMRIKKSMPSYICAANDVLVKRFLNGEITFLDIAYKLEKLMSFHNPQDVLNWQDIFEIEKRAQIEAQKI